MYQTLLDYFTDANGTAIAAHTPNVGGPWTSSNAGLVIQSNKLTGSDALGVAHAPHGRKTMQMSFTLDFNGMDNGSSVKLIVGDDTTPSNGLELTISGDGSMELLQHVGGVSLMDAYNQHAVTPGIFNVRVVCGPSIMSVFMNGKLYCSLPRELPLSIVLEVIQLSFAVAAGLYPTLDALIVTQ